MDTKESKVKIVSVGVVGVFIIFIIVGISQIINGIFMALVIFPQFYVMARPKSSRYCRQPLLSNLAASTASSFIASGFAVIFTLMDPVPQSFRAAYHVFGLLSFGQGFLTAVLTVTAAACAKTTPELYYMSLILTVACILSTGLTLFLGVSSAFFMVKGGVWISKRLPRLGLCGNNEQ